MNKKALRYLKIAFAASALSFGLLIIAWTTVFMTIGLDSADKVWHGIYPIVTWVFALAICWKFLSKESG